MGDYLEAPITAKESEDGECKYVITIGIQLKYGCSGMQGWRNYMEDAHLCVKNLVDGISLFGVFDGHGGNLLLFLGQEVALYAKNHLPDILKNNHSFKSKNYKQALVEAFLTVDQQLESSEGKKELKGYLLAGPRKEYGKEEGADFDIIPNIMGCTACVALVTPTQIFVANAGDSRAVISKKGHALDMSVDHKPSLEKEHKRIDKAGGFIEDDRVNGSLNLSRCFGDLEYKKNKKLKQEEQMITCYPEVRTEKVTNELEFLIIACDGIWDCLTSQGAVDYLKDKVKFPEKIHKISSIVEGMLDSILAKDVEISDGIGCDNMTCLVVCFKHEK